MKPQLEGATTLESGHFAFAVPRGGTARDAGVVVNLSDAPMHLAVYVADTVASSGGGYVPVQKSDEMTRVGSWLRVLDPSQAELDVPAHGRVTVPFALQVPSSVVPGDYLGAFVVSATSPTASGSAIETRAALLVRVRVEGHVHRALRVVKPAASHHGRRYDFTVDVHNEGNVLAVLKGHLAIKGDHGALLTLLPKSTYVIPGGVAHLHATWIDPPTVGRVRVGASVIGSVYGLRDKTYSSPTIRLTIVPIRALAVAVGAAAAVSAAAFSTRGLRRRRRLRRRDEKRVLREHRQAQAAQATTG